MDKNIITNRRREVEAEIERLKLTIGGYEEELAELDTAERVMARLSGAKWVAPSQTNKQEPASASSASKGEPPLTEKIIVVVSDAHRQGRKGLEPKEVYEAIIAKGWSADLAAVRSTTWRIWKHGGRLSKPDADSPLYTVPERENPSSSPSSSYELEDLLGDSNQQNRQAGSGGGT